MLMTGTGSEQTQAVARLNSKSTSVVRRMGASSEREMFGALSCEQPKREMFPSKSTSRFIVNKCQKVLATRKSNEQARRSKSRSSRRMIATIVNGPLLVGLVLFLPSVALLASCGDAVNTQQRPLTISSDNPQAKQVQLVASESDTEQNKPPLERHRRGHREEHLYNGRLVDSIAEPLQLQGSSGSTGGGGGGGGAAADQNQDKLNYIIDFLKQNKLTKFCDLVQNGNVRVRELIKQLNAMSQFTLFVPTNEALLIMSSAQLESIEESPEEARQFLMAHATGELVLPRLSDAAAVQSLGQLASKYSPLGSQNRWSSGRPLERIVQQPPPSASSQTVLYSLAGDPMRIITTPVLMSGSNSTSTTTRLELIVNGANVLSGHSHALQEPNNTNVTYAIVHLIDRPLYPAPKTSLLERIGQVAPRFGRLLVASQDQALLDRLRSSAGQQLTTAFVPNDDAFRSIPSKLLDQLETNRTFLQHFLRSHLAEGVFYSGQLTGPPQDGARNGSQSYAGPTLPRLLTSMAADVELQFETKMIQSRQLILVNSIPIVDQDLAVLNGALHVIVRPLFDRNQLDAACHCESGKQLLADTNQELPSNLSGVVYDPQVPALASGKRDETKPSTGTTLSSWFQNAGRRFMAPPAVVTRNQLGTGGQSDQLELEREETNQNSQQLASHSSGKIIRAQRSDNLVARNNRDFYRPSTAPVNTLGAELGGGSGGELEVGASRRRPEPLLNTSQQTAGGGRGFIGAGSSNELRLANLTSGDLIQLHPSQSSFEVERYKIVMDANMRQKLREQQQQAQLAGGLIMSSSLNHEAARPPQGTDLFVYDQPLAAMPTSDSMSANSSGRTGASFWAYSAPFNQSQANLANLKEQQLLNLSASSQRNQRLLRFQAEDARDGALILDSLEQSLKTASSSNHHQVGSSGQAMQKQQTSKTAAPPFGANFNGCAFYDTECKRLIQLSGKFVRLPARINGKQATTPQFNQSNQAIQSANHNYQPTTPVSVFDTSFGETTIRPSLSQPTLSSSNNKFTLLNNVQPNLQHVVTPPQTPKNYVTFNPPGASGQNQRVSLLNQPLPPWSVDEQSNSNPLIGQSHQQHPAHLGHLSGQLSSISSQNVNWRAQDIGDLARLKQVQQANSSSLGSAPMKAGQPQQVLLVPVELFQDSNISLANARQQMLNNTIGQNRARPIYFAPPSGQLQQQQRPAVSPTSGLIFNSNSQYFTPTTTTSNGNQNQANNQIQRNPSNLSRLTNFTSLEPINSPSDSFDASSSQLTKQRGQRLRDVTSPTQQMILGDEQRIVNETFQSAIEQARKIVRLQSSSSSAPYQLTQAVSANRMEFVPGSAQSKGDISITSVRLTRPQSSGLVVQASNQAPDVSNLSSSSRLSPNLVDQSQQQDFFQNRTIAEVMDDSGLRIDGQQVTFGRLRDCLDQAGLSNLIVQQGNPLTIFMPTDIAFQRLVQQQTAMQQQRSNSNSLTNSRLVDSSLSNQRRYLLPLVVARAGSQRPETGGQSSGGELARLTSADLSNPLDSSLVALAQKLTLDCSTPQVRQLLLDHLSSQLITPKQLQSDLTLNTLSGKRLLLSSVPSKKIVVVDGQPVIAATRAKNGMVYVLNKFLNISQQMPTVIDLLESQPNLKTFQSYLSFASLSDRLKRETGPVTILAPTNEAFEQLSSAARQLLNSDPAAMMDILRGHIIEGAQFGKLISMRNRLKTMNSDHFIEARVMKPNIYQLDNQMTSMRLIGTSGNGVVNAIDRLIVPPWLRVSPGAVGTNQAIGRLSAVSSRVGLPESVRLGSNELDVGSRSNLISRQQNSVLNLPSLNNRPLRFEQPQAARLAPTNSFSLAGSSTANPRDSFDMAQPTPSIGATLDTNFNLNNSRPFSLTPNNLPPAGGRLSGSSAFDSFNSPTGSNDLIPVGPNNSSTTNTVATVNKNMRLIEKLANLMKARKFVKYLLSSRLSESLKPDMNYVILVPTDQAIERLPKQIIDMLDKDLDRLSDLVNFHVLDTTFEYINTIPDGQTLNTLNEKDILFNWHRNNTILTASGAVVLGGIQEENIALLIVDRVLYPTPGDLLSIVTKSPILSNFTNLIKNANLEKQLSLAGPFTLFAPSDFAFNQLDKRDLEFLQQDRESARRFLLRHLSQPAIFTSSIALSNITETRPSVVGEMATTIVPLTSVTNSLGEELILRQKNDYFSVNDVNFSYADVAATNGVVHVIDGLL